MGCWVRTRIREDRPRRWRCRIDDLVASFVFLYIKAYMGLAWVFLVVVRHSALDFQCMNG